jgi:hypothetical protein
MRLEADLIIGTGATDTACVAAFIPGLGLALNNTVGMATDASGSTFSIAGGLTPGAAFLAANGMAIRAVAACTQVTYPGTELNRSGVVSIGVMSAGTLINNIITGEGGGNVGTTPAGVRIATQHVQRMPQEKMECKWFPGDEDANPSSYINRPTAYAQQLNGRNAIVLSASGFPTAVGIRVRNVGVYEISLGSSANTGQVQAVTPPRSSNTAGNVLKFLADKDPQWYLDAANKVGSVIGSIIDYAATGVKAAGTAVNALALIAA